MTGGRGTITNRYKRACTECGNRRHIHSIRWSGECPKCGNEGWTRDLSEVEAENPNEADIWRSA